MNLINIFKKKCDPNQHDLDYADYRQTESNHVVKEQRDYEAEISDLINSNENLHGAIELAQQTIKSQKQQINELTAQLMLHQHFEKSHMSMFNLETTQLH